jgi:prepilin-type N-terminal cleavage/methylation domain-containing protein
VRRAFTLIEMLTTVAVLVIVLGLMVSLARDVRTRSADRLTKDLLRRLDALVEQYRARSFRIPSSAPAVFAAAPPGRAPASGPATAEAEAQRSRYPAVRSLFEGVDPAKQPIDENRLARNALANNKELVRTLKSQVDLSGTAFSDLSIANYTEVYVLDAWGSPVVFMPRQHPSIGMAAGDRSFFFSAGPDRNYLTRQDNLYSYERAGAAGPGAGAERAGP